MIKPTKTSDKKGRNRNFDHTHRTLIEAAVSLISRSGVDAVSVSALARATQINRSTIYYHFENREALIAAVRDWSSDELARGFNSDVSLSTGIEHISSFVLNNPEIIKLWIEDYISTGDIRDRYPLWDSLVANIAQESNEKETEQACDAEVYCTLMLTAAFIAPLVFKNSVCPNESLERIAERFTLEQQRILTGTRPRQTSD